MILKQSKFEHKGQQIDLTRYKYLGWMNFWGGVYFDVDGKITTGDTSKGEKPKRSFSYLTEDNPEYKLCTESNHRQDSHSFSIRGTNNVYWCDECKICWQLDMGD